MNIPDALIEKFANVRIPLKLEMDSEKYIKHLESIKMKNMKKKCVRKVKYLAGSHWKALERKCKKRQVKNTSWRNWELPVDITPFENCASWLLCVLTRHVLLLNKRYSASK